MGVSFKIDHFDEYIYVCKSGIIGWFVPLLLCFDAKSSFYAVPSVLLFCILISVLCHCWQYLV